MRERSLSLLVVCVLVGLLQAVPSRVAAQSSGDDDEEATREDASADDTSGEEEVSDEDLDAELDAALGTNEDAEAERKRASIASLHRTFGIATWGAMTATVVLGFIQYYNLYGFFAGRGDNPCVQGDAIFGQGQCSGTPWLHRTSAILTGALYGTTLTLSFMMPDPGGNLDQGNSEYARTLRKHKVLRWIHLGGMIAQFTLGIITANASSLGLDRTNDYDTLQLLATVHMGIGLVTYGALTWAGAIMTF